VGDVEARLYWRVGKASKPGLRSGVGRWPETKLEKPPSKSERVREVMIPGGLLEALISRVHKVKIGKDLVHVLSLLFSSSYELFLKSV
jgi:hypothetical protein